MLRVCWLLVLALLACPSWCAAAAATPTIILEPAAAIEAPSFASPFLEATPAPGYAQQAVTAAPRVQVLEVPVTVNVVLMGVPPALVSLPLDVLDHVVVPMGEEPVTTRRAPTQPSLVRWRHKLVFHRMPHAGRALEHMIDMSARPDDRPDYSCVDVFRFSQALQHLLASTGLSNAPTVVIFNHSGPTRKPYGYRAGLTVSEMEALDADEEWSRKLRAIAELQSGRRAPLGEAMTFGHGEAGDSAWAEWFMTNVTHLSGSSSGGPALHALTRQLAQSGSDAQNQLMRALLDGTALPDCLVWSWLDEGRTAFYDVTFERDAQLASPVVRSHRQPQKSVRHALSTALRHVVNPGVPPHPLPYADVVVFTLHVVHMHAAYDARQAFDWTRFARALEPLKAPGQQFQFRVNTVASEMVLAARMALRSAVLPGEIGGESSTVVYIDSMVRRNLVWSGRSIAHFSPQVLRDLIKPSTNVMDDDDGKKPTSASLRQRHVAIVLVSTAFPYPVLVDRYFAAKSLRDMVVVAQSNFDRHPSRVQCGGRAVLWDLRNPLRHALAATATHLAGLIPPHVSYSHATQAVEQEWLWSVGESPFAHTSHGHSFSALQADTARRNYVVAALEHSIRTADDAVAAVHSLHRVPQAQVALLNEELASLHQPLLALWRQVAGSLHDTSTLRLLDERTTIFVREVHRVHAVASSLHCSPSSLATHDASFDWTPLMVGVFLLDVMAIIGLLWSMQYAARSKVKIN